MKAYFAIYNSNTIEEVEIEKETPAFVWINGVKTRRDSDHGFYTDSKALALDKLESFLEGKIALIEERLEDYKIALDIYKKSLQELK